jgi:hypothetical protein
LTSRGDAGHLERLHGALDPGVEIGRRLDAGQEKQQQSDVSVRAMATW